MDIRFWGIRGSVPVSGKQYVHAGGNTTCVEVTHDGHRLILDGGTGLRALGAAHGFNPPMQATILFSHVHWDHIQGVPFFTPAFNPDTRLTIAGADRFTGDIQTALAAQMTPPAFPVTLDTMGARIRYETLTHAKPWENGPFRIIPMDMNHPDGVFAYRIEAGGRSMVFAT
jgi:phosphoribosyl 1,2-cyclic phosphodiesterase